MVINKQTGNVVHFAADGRVFETFLGLIDAHDLVAVAFARTEVRMFAENKAGENIDSLIEATHVLARAKGKIEKELDERRLIWLEQAAAGRRAKERV